MKTDVWYSKLFFFENRAVYEIKWKKYQYFQSQQQTLY